jgi:hypothetical protein
MLIIPDTHRIMIKFFYLLSLSVLAISCEKITDNSIPVTDDKNKWVKYFDETQPESHMYISSLALYDDTTIIFSTYKYNNKSLLYIIKNDSLIPIDTSSLLAQLPELKLFYSSKNKKIWQNDHCIILFSPYSKNYMYWTVCNQDSKNSSVLKKDKYGAIWEATYYDGLFKYYNDSCTQYFNGSLFSEICLDNEDNLLIGNLPVHSDEKGLLLKYDYSKWDTIYICSNNAYCVNSMCFDNHNDLWFGVLSRVNIGYEYGGGLIKYDGINFTEFSKDNSGLISNSVPELYYDGHDNIWIGTYYGGICMLNAENNWSNYTFKNDIGINQSFEHIVIDSDSNIYASLYFIGLVKFKKNKT